MTMFERLKSKYGDQGFEILAFPSNEFGAQRGNIAACATKYKANYKIFEEVKVALALYRPFLISE